MLGLKMLTCLQIRDFAIIDQLQVEFGSGLNVLTGETGAGKSILISALELVLGGKGRPEHVRAGAKQAEVEALFDIEADRAIRQRLEALDVGESELVVRRVVMPNGRTKAFVNGRLATREQLADLARGLVDISSQHLHHSLTDRTTHLGYLDAFAGLCAEREQVRVVYRALEDANLLLRDFEDRIRDRSAREALLKAALSDIESVAPHPDEDRRLDEESASLRHCESLLQLTGEAADLLYERDASAVDVLAQAGQRLQEASLLNPDFSELAERLETARSALQDAARDLSRYVHSIRPDPVQLERTEQRLFELCKLKRRYGGTLEAVLEHLAHCRAELEELEHHVETGQTLRAKHASALLEAITKARALSTKRRRAATRLAKAMTQELSSLGMGEARVRVDIGPLSGHGIELTSPGLGAVQEEAGATSTPSARLGPDGMDTAEFLIAPNRGEEALPLRKVASGGELSRAMLAIKCVLADLGPAGMYAFDEVDSGVGGGMAEVIGRKVYAVARHRQVLCVTHLPQIAVFADHHFKVEKSLQGERTLSTIRRLSSSEQREEIARMLGGLKITQKTRAAARELLQQARRSAA